MDPVTLALIGGGLGFAKGEFVDKPRERRQRAYAAEVMRYSPWTGMQAQLPQEADPMGSAMQGAMAGASFGQNMQTVDNQNALMKAQTDALNRGQYSGWMGIPVYGPYGAGPNANSSALPPGQGAQFA